MPPLRMTTGGKTIVTVDVSSSIDEDNPAEVLLDHVTAVIVEPLFL